MNTYDIIAPYYDIIYGRDNDGEINFYYEEAKKANGPVLEIGCGTGRIFLQLLEKGIDIAGIDNSSEMVRILKKRAKEKGLSVDVRIADMLDFSYDRKFSLVIIPYRSFLHMLNENDQLKTLANIRSHLSENGRLIIHSYNPSQYELTYTGEAYRSIEVIEHVDKDTGQNILIHWDLKYGDRKKLLHYLIRFEKDGKEIQIPMSIAHLPDKIMRLLLKKSGFGNIKVYGDFNYWPVLKGSTELIYCAQRAKGVSTGKS